MCLLSQQMLGLSFNLLNTLFSLLLGPNNFLLSQMGNVLCVLCMRMCFVLCVVYSLICGLHHSMGHVHLLCGMVLQLECLPIHLHCMWVFDIHLNKSVLLLHVIVLHLLQKHEPLFNSCNFLTYMV